MYSQTTASTLCSSDVYGRDASGGSLGPSRSGRSAGASSCMAHSLIGLGTGGSANDTCTVRQIPARCALEMLMGGMFQGEAWAPPAAGAPQAHHPAWPPCLWPIPSLALALGALQTTHVQSDKFQHVVLLRCLWAGCFRGKPGPLPQRALCRRIILHGPLACVLLPQRPGRWFFCMPHIHCGALTFKRHLHNLCRGTPFSAAGFLVS